MHIRRIPRRADGIADQPGSSGELERVPIDYLRKQRRAAEEQKIILSVTTGVKRALVSEAISRTLSTGLAREAA